MWCSKYTRNNWAPIQLLRWRMYPNSPLSDSSDGSRLRGALLSLTWPQMVWRSCRRQVIPILAIPPIARAWRVVGLQLQPWSFRPDLFLPYLSWSFESLLALASFGFCLSRVERTARVHIFYCCIFEKANCAINSKWEKLVSWRQTGNCSLTTTPRSISGTEDAAVT